MENYSIEIKKSASKELLKLPKKALESIIDKIQNLSIEPRPIGISETSKDL